MSSSSNPPKLLCILDKFKSTLTAQQAGTVVSLAAVKLGARAEHLSLTDGGEGFVEILTNARQGRLVEFPVCDPLLRPHKAPLGLINEDSGVPSVVLEMATTSGLQWLESHERNPFKTTTRGTGELLREALFLEPAEILLGIGGSATNDLGLGALEALGLEAYDEHVNRITPLKPMLFPRVKHLRVDRVPDLAKLQIACDVTNPLLGERGCTRVFGPQKGLQSQDMPQAEQELERMAKLLLRATRQEDWLLQFPGSGAAGGLGFGLSLFGATLVPGFKTVARWIKLDAKLQTAQVVLTGEGCFDRSSLAGKGPAEVLRRAAQNPSAILMCLSGKIEPGVIEQLEKELGRTIYSRSLIPFEQEEIPSLKETVQLIQIRLEELLAELPIT